VSYCQLSQTAATAELAWRHHCRFSRRWFSRNRVQPGSCLGH